VIFIFLVCPAAAENVAITDPKATSLNNVLPDHTPDSTVDSKITKAGQKALKLNNNVSFNDLFNNVLDIRDVDDWVLGSGLMVSPSFPSSYVPVNKSLEPEKFSTDAVIGHQVDQAKTSGTVVLLDNRLSIGADLSLESHVYDDFGTSHGQIQDKSQGFSSVKAKFGADYFLTPNWSLGASVSIRDTQSFGLHKSGATDWFGPSGLYPSDLRMGQASLEYQNAGGTRAALSGYMGAITSDGADRLAAARNYRQNINYADLYGLGVTFQQSFLEGRFNVRLAAMLNSFDLRTKNFRSISNQGQYSQKLSAYLSMSYLKPSLFNAAVLYRYGSDGYFITDSMLKPGSNTSYLDARIWRDFNLTPSLSFSTQIYSSTKFGNYIGLYRPPTNLNLLDNYVEGRMTMNYAF
jgi:hypothetical protein